MIYVGILLLGAVLVFGLMFLRRLFDATDRLAALVRETDDIYRDLDSLDAAIRYCNCVIQPNITAAAFNEDGSPYKPKRRSGKSPASFVEPGVKLSDGTSLRPVCERCGKPRAHWVSA